jgi:hypothetical protein
MELGKSESEVVPAATVACKHRFQRFVPRDGAPEELLFRRLQIGQVNEEISWSLARKKIVELNGF